MTDRQLAGHHIKREKRMPSTGHRYTTYPISSFIINTHNSKLSEWVTCEWTDVTDRQTDRRRQMYRQTTTNVLLPSACHGCLVVLLVCAVCRQHAHQQYRQAAQTDRRQIVRPEKSHPKQADGKVSDAD
mmetsp:Transcript_30146/g.74881  ORF Transcript_30146/g.74881 Transcript_30146/m.74881 type:complete len:129 (-) Transcript_30146:44-430(-)